ncbi:PH domain-containing protein [Lampropedia puyangensis]|uniref:PH domain-containing protein n=1 Tax=Lampropedia puyangensis TaxID=1330072 RepID=A0A4S8EU90_9BURK|nr:PH domain-containing protein [Lampropedia puyangensis]THT98417.1 PH domain-containing protein [Lampropedia puyangensis]
MDLEQASMTPGGARHVPESTVLWSETEGQAANALTYLLCLLTFWLVLPVGYAVYRFLRSATTRYTLTDQRLLMQTGIIVKQIDTLELYRVKDITVDSSILLTLFGRGSVVLQSTDTTHPTKRIHAIASPARVATLMRDRVKQCRVLKGVRAFDH